MALPDRALRQMVARLADMMPDDYEAVLERIPERHRSRIAELVAELSGFAGNGGPAANTLHRDAVTFPPGLSAWLLARLGAEGFKVEALPGDEAMTAHARAALRASAAELYSAGDTDSGRTPASRFTAALGAIGRRGMNFG